MTRLSLRYLYPLSACLLLALVPVVVHSYLQVEADDCRSGVLLPESTLPPDGSGKRDDWIGERFQSSHWREGSFVKDGLRFDFAVIRSYDAKRLYHLPENSLVEHTLVVQRRGTDWVPADAGTLPVHRAYYGDTDPVMLVAYLLVYRSAPVANPYWLQLRSAPIELFSGRHPMTLFFIQARGSRASFPQMEDVGREWLLSSWQKYRSACIH